MQHLPRSYSHLYAKHPTLSFCYANVAVYGYYYLTNKNI